EPPTDIWPTPEQRKEEKHHFQRVDRTSNWVLPKPKFRMGYAWFAAALIPFLFHGCAENGASNPLDYDGPSFLGFYAVSLAIAAVVS
ncbi:hypothetical protein ABTN55_20405, partial [Acinetobacter baumannii]